MTIEDILYRMMIHSAENPTHGYNCACKDRYLREGRRAVMAMDPKVRQEMRYLFRIMLSESDRIAGQPYPQDRT